MATVSIWPALGVTVVDENNDTIPTGGITVTWSEYYENLLRRGLVKTFDPTGLNGSPGPVEPLLYDGLGLEYEPESYTETAATIGGHLEGIDDALGAIQSDVADANVNATQALADAATAQSTADAHATRHVRGGADEVDGDLLDVDYSSTNYTKTVAATSSHVDHLASHLKGIDDELGTIQTTANAAQVKFTFGTDISGATTLDGTDRWTIRKTSGSGNHAISVSGDGRHTAGDQIAILHRGTGTPTIAGTGGMTVNKPTGTAASFFDQGSPVVILFESATVCHLIGRLTPT